MGIGCNVYRFSPAVLAGINLSRAQGRIDADACDSLWPNLRGGRSNAPLDTNWHALHMLLCMTSEPCDSPLSFLLAGGTEFVTHEMEMLPPSRLFTAAHTQVIAACVLNITPGILVARHRVGMFAANDIYRWSVSANGGFLADFARIDQPLHLRDIVSKFVRLRRLMKAAFEREEGLFVAFS